MSGAEWSISGPLGVAWTPAELAQIGRAVQAFVAALPNASGRMVHEVTLNGVIVLDGQVKVDWPQPADPSESEVAFGTVLCSVCGQPVPADRVHTHSRGEQAIPAEELAWLKPARDG